MVRSAAPTSLLVALYLSAAVAANLVIAAFGPSAAIVVAFLLVGLDLTTRDALHSRWEGRHLAIRMGTIIVAGGVLSFLVNGAAGPVAVASSVAFAAAAIVDAIAYRLLRDRSWYWRANGSNVPSALVDSLVFPTLAFGAFLPAIVLGQFVAKVAGGALWSYVLRPRPVRYVVGEAGPERFIPGAGL